MATVPDLENKRRGFWLRVARERANLTQEAVIRELGLSSRSKSTMSAWESGAREPKLRYLTAMARLYDVPVSLFLEPAPTAEEELDERLADLAGQAIRSALADVEEEARGQRSDGPPGAQPGRRTA